jgi:hypothetical protein
MISLMAAMEDGHSAQMSMFASTNVMGLTAATVTNQAFGCCVSQITGTASWINISKMRSFMESSMVCVRQSIDCNAIHSVEVQCARLLLTYEFWAKRLGVRRSSIRAVRD